MLVVAISIIITVSILPIVGRSNVLSKVEEQQQQYAYAQQQGNPAASSTSSPPILQVASSTTKVTTITPTDDTDTFKIDLRIRGIDYSDKMAKVWVIVNDNTVSFNINPVKLLDPQDDGDGIIHVPIKLHKAMINPGDKFTACIKVLTDSDNFGNHYSCQKGTISISTPLPTTTAARAQSDQSTEAETLDLML